MTSSFSGHVTVKRPWKLDVAQMWHKGANRNDAAQQPDQTDAYGPARQCAAWYAATMAPLMRPRSETS
jgi:hypothetical protein